MTSMRNHLESNAFGRARRAGLLLFAILAVGLGTASPALADHGYRNGPSVVFRAGFPLPFLFPLPVPVPVPVPFLAVPVVRQPYYGGGQHVHGRRCGHYRGHYRGYDRRAYYRGNGYRDDWDDRGGHGKRGKKHKRGH
jgi:hypothetical protein